MEKEVSEGDSSRVYNEQVGRVVDEINKNPMSLEPAAAAGGVQIQTIAPFARGAGSGIAANNAVVQAAFSEALTQDGTVSDPIEIGPNQTVFIRVTSHTPSSTTGTEKPAASSGLRGKPASCSALVAYSSSMTT